MHAVTQVPAPINETVLDYAPGSPERAALEVAVADLAANAHELPMTIGGRRVHGKGAKARGSAAACPPRGPRARS